MPDGTFTQEQVKHLIDVEGIKVKINSIDDKLSSLAAAFEHHASKSDKETELLKSEITETERKLVNCRNTVREEIYTNFVQFKQLKLWLAIGIFVATGTVTAAQWVMYNSESQVERVAQKIVTKINKDQKNE